MYIRVSVNLCLLSVFLFPVHNRPLYQPVTSLWTVSKGVCECARAVVCSSRCVFVCCGLLLCVPLLSSILLWNASPSELLLSFQIGEVAGESVCAHVCVFVCVSECVIWHILGSVPMHAAPSSKQLRVEPLNQSVSLTATTYNLVTALVIPVSLIAQNGYS